MNGCGGPTAEVHDGRGPLRSRLQPGGGGCGHAETGWGECHFPTKTPPGPCIPTGRYLRHREGFCPIRWGPRTLIGGPSGYYSHHPASFPCLYPYYMLQNKEILEFKKMVKKSHFFLSLLLGFCYKTTFHTHTGAVLWRLFLVDLELKFRQDMDLCLFFDIFLFTLEESPSPRDRARN